MSPATKVPWPKPSSNGSPSPVRSTPPTSRPAKSASGSIPVSTTATVAPVPSVPASASRVAPVVSGKTAAGWRVGDGSRVAGAAAACRPLGASLVSAIGRSSETVTLGSVSNVARALGVTTARTALPAPRSLAISPPCALTTAPAPAPPRPETMTRSVVAGEAVDAAVSAAAGAPVNREAPTPAKRDAPRPAARARRMLRPNPRQERDHATERCGLLRTTPLGVVDPWRMARIVGPLGRRASNVGSFVTLSGHN